MEKGYLVIVYFAEIVPFVCKNSFKYDQKGKTMQYPKFLQVQEWLSLVKIKNKKNNRNNHHNVYYKNPEC